MTLRIWLSAFIENDGGDEGEEDEMVSLADGDTSTLMEMLNAGLLPLVLRPMARYPQSAGLIEHCLAVLTAVCGYRPPASVAAIVIAAGVMPRIVAALSAFRADSETELEMLRAALPLLKCLTRDASGCRAAAMVSTQAIRPPATVPRTKFNIGPGIRGPIPLGHTASSISNPAASWRIWRSRAFNSWSATATRQLAAKAGLTTGLDRR